MRAILVVCLTAALLGGGLAIRAAANQEPDRPRLRIGTYDNRAIAIAIAPTKLNPALKLQERYQEANEAGDRKRMAELTEQLNAMQRRFHRMGFARVPVDELLEPVKDRLPEVAAAAGVDAIVFDCNWAGADVEVVDLTDELVALFDPSPRVLKWVRQIKDTPPLDLDVLEQHGHDHDH